MLFRSRYVLLRRFYNKQVSASFEANYEERFGSNNFRDLEANLYTEVIASGESMIYCKNDKYMFTFHDYVVITIDVKRRNKKNIDRAAAFDAAILDGFPAL